MVNKFDEIVHGKESETTTKKTTEKDDDENVKKVDIRISFSWKPILVERIIYILAILTLIFFIFQNPLCDLSWNTITTQNVSVETEETPTEETTVEEVDTTEETTDEPDTTNEPEEDLPINASLSVKRMGIILENTSTSSYKVDKITFQIINSGATLIGEVKILMYDEDDTAEVKARAAATKAVIIPEKQTMTIIVEDFNKRFLNSDNEEETFEFKLYDKDKNMLDKHVMEITP